MQSNTPAALPADAVAAIERGELVLAIKLVRDRTGLGLKESKEAVDRYQAGDRLPLVAPPRATDIFSAPLEQATNELPSAVVEAMRRGNKMEAIKQLRDARPGLGLAQAKDLVEAYAEGRSPTLSGGFSESPPQAPMNIDPMAEPGRVKSGQWRSSLFWIAFILLAVFGVWSLLARL